MTVQLLRDGRVYHVEVLPDGSSREHFHNGSIRESADAFILDCAECDALTLVPKNERNADFRGIRDMIRAGFDRIKAAPKSPSDWDAFRFAIEDGVSLAQPRTASERESARKAMRAARRG